MRYVTPIKVLWKPNRKKNVRNSLLQFEFGRFSVRFIELEFLKFNKFFFKNYD